MSPNAADPRLCLVAMVKNAAGEIEPWLDYHRALGVTGAILLLDDSTDDTRARLAAYDWVTVLDAPPRSEHDRGLAPRQGELLPFGAALADEAGFDWALLIDPDEYLWPHDARTPLAEDVLDQGSLPKLFARVGPAVEQVQFPTNEGVPVASSTAATFLDNPYLARHPVTRDLRLPGGSGPMHLDRFLGHRFGKAAVRAGVPLAVDHSPHRWRNSDGTSLRTLSIGCLIHHHAGDVELWQNKFARHAWQSDRWSHNDSPVPDHIVAWRSAAAEMTIDEARQYFDDEVALPADRLEAALADRTVIEAPIVSEVLRAGRRTTRPPAAPSRRSPVVFLAFDACDFERMLELADRGHAPNMAKLRAQSYAVPTVASAGVYVGAIWPDFHTAAHPGHHGRHSWKQIIPGTYDISPGGVPRGLTHPTIYERLTAAGRHVAVVDPPLIPLLDSNATQILEWGSHDPVGGPASAPVELIEEIVAHHGAHPLPEHCNSHDRSLERHVSFRDALVEGAGAKTAVLLDLYPRYDWDLFAGVYKESHCVGHQMWHLTDPTFPFHDPEIAAEVGEPIVDVYCSLDDQLGEWANAIDDDTTLVVWLTHGIGPHNDPTFYLDVILRRIESTRRFRREWTAAREVLATAPVGAERTVAQERVKELNQRIWDDVHHRPIGERDFFYAPNNEVEGGIRLNIAGREPAGTVAPADRAQLTQWITERLLELTDADTGERLAAEVLDLHERYPGPLTDRLPDLAVLWNRPDHQVAGVASPLLRGVQRLSYRGTRSGDHHPRGRAFISRPGEVPGAHDRPISTGELGATVAVLAGLPPGLTVCEAITLPTRI